MTSRSSLEGPLTFDADSHTYSVQGVRLPSVTEVIRFGGEGTDYSSVPSHILERAREIGKKAHKTVELYHEQDDHLFTNDSSVNAYLDGYQEFIDTGVYEHLMSEQKMYCSCHGFAGTVDKVGWVNGALSVIDIKTTNKLNLEHVELQTAAYQHLASRTFDMELEKRFVLHLKKSRDFNLVACDDETSWPRFRKLLREYHEEKNG